MKNSMNKSTFDMKSTIYNGKILLVEFPEGENNRDVCLALHRLSAFYESPILAGKRFTHDQWLETIMDGEGNMNIYEWFGEFYSYFQYWDGFNLPKKVLDKFECVFKDSLTDREKAIIKAARKLPHDGYIIALTENGLQTTRRHEFAHALFYTIKAYKQESLAVVASMPQSLKDKIWANLQRYGYSLDVLSDEIEAYLVAFDEEESPVYFPDIFEELRPYAEQMALIYPKYSVDK